MSRCFLILLALKIQFCNIATVSLLRLMMSWLNLHFCVCVCVFIPCESIISATSLCFFRTVVPKLFRPLPLFLIACIPSAHFLVLQNFAQLVPLAPTAPFSLTAAQNLPDDPRGRYHLFLELLLYYICHCFSIFSYKFFSFPSLSFLKFMQIPFPPVLVVSDTVFFPLMFP